MGNINHTIGGKFPQASAAILFKTFFKADRLNIQGMSPAFA